MMDEQYEKDCMKRFLKLLKETDGILLTKHSKEDGSNKYVGFENKMLISFIERHLGVK